MRRVCREEPMKSVRPTSYQSGNTEYPQFILDGADRQGAISNYLAEISRTPFAAKEQSEDFRSGFRKQYLKKGFLGAHS